MKLRSSEPFWIVKNELVQSYPALPSSLSTEVLIIGGGITGALIAYALLKEGKKVILLDKRDVCSGSTAASTALLQYEIDTPLHQLIEQRGLATAISSYKNCEQAIYSLKKIIDEIEIQCDFEFKLSIYFTAEENKLPFLKQEFLARKEHGFNVRWVEKEELNSWGLEALAAIESESGAVMDPYRFSQQLLKRCVEMGLQIYDKTTVTTIKNENGKPVVYTEDGHEVQAEHVVNCSGYESKTFLKENVVDLKSTFALCSEAMEEIPSAFKYKIYWNASDPYYYFRMSKDKRIMMGGADVRFKNVAARDKLIAKKEKLILEKFSNFFPDIPFKLDYAWAGTFGETKDGLPYMGKPDNEENIHYILGFGGNGITFSVMGMDAIIHSLNNTPHVFLQDYRFDR